MEYEGKLIASNDVKVAIVVSKFNKSVTDKLRAGAKSIFLRYGIAENNIDTVWVPGAFEIPAIAKLLLSSNKYDGVCALGSVIKGQTSHYDYVCSGVTSGINQIALEFSTPITFGVLTTDTLEQAQQRAGGKGGNKGEECATDIVELMDLRKQLS